VTVYEDPPAPRPSEPDDAAGTAPPATVSWPPVSPPAPRSSPTAGEPYVPPPPPESPSFPPPAPPAFPPLAPPPFSTPPKPRSHARLTVVFVAIALVLGFGVTTLILNATDSTKKSASSSTPSTAAPQHPTTSTTLPKPDAHAAALLGLGVTQADVPVGYTVRLQDGGNDFVHGTTLDLCNGTFKSESLRTARNQVVVLDSSGNQLLSTEAVLYKSPDAAAQALKELRAVVAKCPNRPVTSPVGEGTVTTKFLAAPDASWPHSAGVTRAAYDFQVAAQGQTVRSTAVYLWRGRALLAIYFSSSSGDQVAVQGKTTIRAIEGVFETRLAALPLAVVR